MFCTNCGAARQGGSNYCGGCGNLFGGVSRPTVLPNLPDPATSMQPSPSLDQQKVAAPAQAGMVDVYCWALATSPIAILIFDGILTGAFGSNAGTVIGWFLAIGFVLTAVSLDSSQLRKFGIRLPFWMGAVLPPLYLFKRAKATNRNQAAFITWLAACGLLFIVALAGIGSSNSGVGSESYRAGQQAGYAAAQDRFNDLFASIEDSCAAKSDYYSWSNYQEFIQGCVDEYRYQTD
jgi:hypothetical protein